jgi:hypothetical protein
MNMTRAALFSVLVLLAASATAADLPKWMAGSWKSVAGPTKMEEHWTTPDGDVMLGIHRDVRTGGKTSFEFLRIERKEGQLVYLAMPGGRPATPFPLKTITETRVVFENPQHDFPQRIIYWREGEKLCARVEGTIRGEAESEQWCWVRFGS